LHRVSVRAARRALVVALVALPLLYGATELWGFGSYATPTSTLPPGVAAADRSMAPGAAALVLPWAAYLPAPWLGGRVVANPYASAFARPVLAGDDLEVGPISTESQDPRSRFITFALSAGPHLRQFGRVLQPLGVPYVVVAKVGAWHDFAWLDRQRDLRRVFDSDRFFVYRTTEPALSAYSPHGQVTVADWGAVLALAERQPLVGYLLHVRHARPGALVAPALPTALPPRVLVTASTSPTAVRVHVARAPAVVIAQPAFAGWRLGGYSTTSQFGVTAAFVAPRPHPGVATATWGPWRLIEWSYTLGALLLIGDVVLIAALEAQRRRRTIAPHPHPRPAEPQ
jgi:hypothetical protein